MFSCFSAKPETSSEKLSTDLKRLVNENIEFRASIFDTNWRKQKFLSMYREEININEKIYLLNGLEISNLLGDLKAK